MEKKQVERAQKACMGCPVSPMPLDTDCLRSILGLSFWVKGQSLSDVGPLLGSQLCVITHSRMASLLNLISSLECREVSCFGCLQYQRLVDLQLPTSRVARARANLPVAFSVCGIYSFLLFPFFSSLLIGKFMQFHLTSSLDLPVSFIF